MEIAIVGATGQTGSSIVDALLASDTPKFSITALTRPSSLKKPAVLGLAKRGVKIAAADLDGPQADLEKTLAGVDVVISTIYGGSVLAELSLINASQAAGVKRYIPCFFATVAPPKGVLLLRELKEDVLNHIKKIKLPYTVIDVGWWYQVNLPRLPSGRIDYAVMETSDGIAGDGNVPIALTDSRDIGRYVARIISDPRTLNRMVFSYTEVVTHNQIYDLLEGLSGEKLERRYVPAEAIEASVAEAEAKHPSPDSIDFVVLAQYQYWYSCGVRGDNTPENARYLGYLIAQELYPDLKGISLAAYTQEVLDGKGKRAYEHLKDLPAARAASTA
ncbi:isoflavone reductase-like protein [Colletotrichum liriopes]|uniref:Isoflavone reductase-like protein n=1 Tax=Colletotrichum liriopes TaxID=708192 RepID=A0AA37GL02_9PEZI|nr:isoflavone reductase-like protein [Colletotrichum liriopes]